MIDVLDEFEPVPMASSGKRCGVQWTPWMGDWFTSWSPRNSNSNAEGPWDHWVDLALHILHDPLTAKVHPEAHQAAAGVAVRNFYDETRTELSAADLAERFGRARSEKS